MNSRIILALIASAGVGFGALKAGAQSRDSTRSTEAQALRYESYFGNARIIRGADGPVVGTAGWFRDFDVEKLVATSPSALSDARLYKSNNVRASVVGSIGATVTLIGVAVTANASNNASSPILIIGGVGDCKVLRRPRHHAYTADDHVGA